MPPLDHIKHSMAHILIVEDEDAVAVLASRKVAKAGHTSEIAFNGREALDLLEAAHAAGTSFDLALVDLMMPIMDGPTFTQTIRQDARFNRIPVLGLTAVHDGESRLMASGANKVLLKPYTYPDLVSGIDEVLLEGA